MAAAKKKKNHKSTKSQRKILIVEDDKANLLIARLTLEELGYQFDSASNSAEALKKLEKEHFDLILMDLHMRGRDGIETTKIIKNMEMRGEIKPIPIIALTSDDLIGDKERCFEAGMDDFLNKPIDIKLLDEKLQYHFE